MGSAEKRMSKLDEYIRKKSYAKIQDALAYLKSIKTDTEEYKLVQKYKPLLLNFASSEIKKYITSNKRIEKTKIEILADIDEICATSLQFSLKNKILMGYIKEFQQQNTKLTNLINIKNVLDNLNEMFDKVRYICTYFPKKHNIEGDFLFNCVLHVKEILFESYMSRWSIKEYVEALKCIVEFEQKTAQYYFLSNCCSNNKDNIKNQCKEKQNTDKRTFSEDKNKDAFCSTSKRNFMISKTDEETIKNNQEMSSLTHPTEDTNDNSTINMNMKSRNKMLIYFFGEDKFIESEPTSKTNFVWLHDNNQNIRSNFCIHKKMLSHLLLPNIDYLIDSLLSSFKRIIIRQECTEMNIIASFIQFFRNIGNILKIIQHFECEKVHRMFLMQVNDILCNMIMEINCNCGYYDLLVILNTLYFVENTFIDLSEKIKNHTSISLRVRDCIRKLEIKTVTRIESILKTIFKEKIAKKTQFAEDLTKIINEKILILNQIDFCEGVFMFLFETLFSILFSNIIKLKMTPGLSELLIEELGEVKLFLKENWHNVPLLNIIENYLKIFICHTNDARVFVCCFNELNNNIFDFQNIINALKDKSNNAQLMKEYKKQTMRLVKFENITKMP